MHPYIHSFHNKRLFIKMGQDISKACTPPPLTFRNCFEDGGVDVAKFMIFNKAMNEEEEEEEMFETQYFSNNNKRKCSGQEGNVISSTKKARSTKRYIFYCRADDGTLREAAFKDSS